MKNISILGSTGSIGTQTLDIVRENPAEFKVMGLSVNSNIGLLKKQIDEFEPEAVAVMDEEKADLLDVDIPVYKGMEGLIKVATLDSCDTVLTSVVGSVGMLPTIEAIKKNKIIALANKETLVTAGDIVMKELKKCNGTMMPVDSEHSALFQCLNGEDISAVNKLIITCSGGAFKDKTLEEMKSLKAADALKHPTWNMGAKITIDSATLMNKGFEVIEAHHLYDMPYEKIEVVVHPQSIIHSMVEFNDHSIMAQLGSPDMRIPIQYALTYPKRMKNLMKPLNFAEIKELTFKEPDLERFPCLKYAFIAGDIGGSMPAVLNAANEIAVAAFLKDKIGYLDIHKIIKKMMDEHKNINNPDLEDIMDVDKMVKEKVRKEIEER